MVIKSILTVVLLINTVAPLYADDLKDDNRGQSLYNGIEGMGDLDEVQIMKDLEESKLVIRYYANLLEKDEIPGVSRDVPGGEIQSMKVTERFLQFDKRFDNSNFAKFYQDEIRSCPVLFFVDAFKDKRYTIRAFICKREEKMEMMSVYELRDIIRIKLRDYKGNSVGEPAPK